MHGRVFGLGQVVLGVSFVICWQHHAAAGQQLQVTSSHTYTESMFFGAEIIRMSGDFDAGNGSGLLAVSDPAAWVKQSATTLRFAGAVQIFEYKAPTLANGTRILQLKNRERITDGQGLEEGVLGHGSYFGVSLGRAPDLNRDGASTELVVGCVYCRTSQNSPEFGAVFVLFLAADASVESYTMISSSTGGGPPLKSRDGLGRAVAFIGPHTLVASAFGDDTAGSGTGAVYIMELSADGVCTSYIKITDGLGLPDGTIGRYNFWGVSAAFLGDLNNDGLQAEVAVCSAHDQGGGTSKGACLILFLASDLKTVDRFVRIGDGSGGVEAGTIKGNNFGMSVARGDGNGDGNQREILVSSVPHNSQTAVYHFQIGRDGTALTSLRIPTLDFTPEFGRSNDANSASEIRASFFEYHGDALEWIPQDSDPYGPMDVALGAPGTSMHFSSMERADGSMLFLNYQDSNKIDGSQQQRCLRAGSRAFSQVTRPTVVSVSQADQTTTIRGRVSQSGGQDILVDVRMPASWRQHGHKLPEERMGLGLPAVDTSEDPASIRVRIEAGGLATNCTQVRQRRSSCGSVIRCTVGPGAGRAQVSIYYTPSLGRNETESSTLNPTAISDSVSVRFQDPNVNSAALSPQAGFAPRQSDGEMELFMYGSSLFDKALHNLEKSLPFGIQVFIGPYECQEVRASYGGSRLRLLMPGGFGGPHRVRFALPGNVSYVAPLSTAVRFEPAVVEGLIPSLVYLNPAPGASQVFQVQGRLMGAIQGAIDRVTVGGLECSNLTTTADDSSFNCTAPLSGYTSNDVIVYHGQVKSVGGVNLLEYTVPPRIAGASPAQIPVSGGVNVSFFGYIGQSRSQIGQVYIGDRPCLQWSVLSEVVLECLAPPGTGSSLRASILSPFGVRTFSAFPLVSYDSPELEAVMPKVLVSNPTAAYDFVLTGRNFGEDGRDLVAVGVGGAECERIRLINSTSIACEGARPPWSSTEAFVQISDQTGTLVAAVEYQPQPSVLGVQPKTIPTAGRDSDGNEVFLTVSGEGFGNSLAEIANVTVGGIECLQIVHVSAFELQCLVPPGIGTGKRVIVDTVANGNSTSTEPSGEGRAAATVSYDVPQVRGVQALTWGTSTNLNDTQTGAAAMRQPRAYIIGGQSNVTLEMIIYNAGSRLNGIRGVRFLIDDDEDSRRGWGCNDAFSSRTSCVGGNCELVAIRCPGLDFTGVDQVGALRPSFSVGGQAAVAVATTDSDSTNAAMLPLSIEIVGSPSVSIVTPSVFPTVGSDASMYVTSHPEVGAWSSRARLVGVNFGYEPADVVNATVGGRPATHVQQVSPSEVMIQVPPGVGKDIAVVMTTSGGLSSDGTSTLSYEKPESVALSPTYVFAGLGRETITITGKHFGNALDDVDKVELQVAGLAENIVCESVAWVDPFELECTLDTTMLLAIPSLGISAVEAAQLQSTNGTGQVAGGDARGGAQAGAQTNVRVPLAVSVGKQMSDVDSGTPRITVIGKPRITLVSPSIMPTIGSPGAETPVQLIGEGFGNSQQDVLAVTIGGIPCRHVTYVSSGELQMSMPPGAGTGLPVVVTTRGGLQSAASPQARISYHAPDVTYVAPSHIFVSNLSATVRIDLVGSNLGPPGTVDPSYGVMLDMIPCNVTRQNQTSIECELDAKSFDRYPELLSTGSAASVSSGRLAMVTPVSARIPVVVAVRGQLSPASTGAQSSLEVVGRPQVNLITPRVIPTAGSRSLVTTGSESQTENVRVVGNGFGFEASDVIQVLVGGKPSPRVVWIGTTELQIVVPPGVGKLQAVEVHTCGGLSSLSTSEGSFVQYRQSQAAAIDPTYSMTGALKADFSIQGTDFGNGPDDVEAVLVGGRPCASITWISPTAIDCTGVDASEWDGSSVVAVVGGQTGGGNTIFEAVGRPLVDVVSPALFMAGDSIVVLGQRYGYSIEDVEGVTIAGTPCQSLELLGPTALQCIAPAAPADLEALATETPEVLRNLPLVVTTSGGLTSVPFPVSYAGSGVAPIHRPADLLAFRPVGSSQRINVRWTFPQEDPTDAVEPIRQFEILLQAASAASDSSEDSAETEEFTSEGEQQQQQQQQFQIVSVRADGVDEIVQTREGMLVYRHMVFAFTSAPVFIRIRASNSVGPGPYSELATGPVISGVARESSNDVFVEGLDGATGDVPAEISNITQRNAIRASCKESEFLGSHLPIDQQRCMPCPDAAYCGGGGSNNVTARDGFWRVPWSKAGLGFSKCFFPPACLGYETFHEVASSSGSENAQLQRRRRSLQAQASSALAGGNSAGQLYSLDVELNRDSPPSAVPVDELGNPLVFEQCTEGYTGVLCSACSPGYARWSNHECRKCKSSRMLAAALLGIFLFVFLVVAWLVLSALRINSNPNGQRIETAILKIMFNHAQTVSIAASLDLRWPDSAMQLFSMMQTGGFSSSHVLSLDCMIEVPDGEAAGFTLGNRTVLFQEDTVGTNVQVPYQSMFLARSLIILCIPLILIAFAAAFWVMVAPCAKLCLACCPKTSEHDSEQSDVAKQAAASIMSLRRASLGSDPKSTQSQAKDLLALTAAKYRKDASGDGMSSHRRSSSGGSESAPSPSRRRSSFAMVRERFSLSQRFVGAELTLCNKIMVTSLIILFLGHMSVTQTSLGLLTCTNVEAATEAGVPEGADIDSIEVYDVNAVLNDDLDEGCPASHPERRLLGDLDVCCYDPRALAYMFGLGLPGMLIYAVGIPCLAAVAIYWQRNNLNDPIVRATLGFLYAGYRESSWFWESVVMLRKVSIATVAVFLEPQGVAVQTYAALAIIFLLTIVQLKVEPFDPVKAPILNHMELASLVASFITFECGLFLVDDEASTTYKALASVGIILANVGFLGWAVSRLGLSAYRSWQESEAQQAAVERGSLRNVTRNQNGTKAVQVIRSTGGGQTIRIQHGQWQGAGAGVGIPGHANPLAIRVVSGAGGRKSRIVRVSQGGSHAAGSFVTNNPLRPSSGDSKNADSLPPGMGIGVGVSASSNSVEFAGPLPGIDDDMSMIEHGSSSDSGDSGDLGE